MIKYLKHLGYVVLGVLAIASAPLFVAGIAVFTVYTLGVSFCRLIETLLK